MFSMLRAKRNQIQADRISEQHLSEDTTSMKECLHVNEFNYADYHMMSTMMAAQTIAETRYASLIHAPILRILISS